MISIIISSHYPPYFENLQKNIADTIGVEYEIIKVDNPELMGICEAYIVGTEKAKYEMLCYAHEDIQFKTKDWGKKVIDVFAENQNLGLLGIAGNVYKSITPSHWSFETANPDSFYVNVLHNSDTEDKTCPFYLNPKKCHLQEVATIDGVWFCVPKKIVLEFPFDQHTCTGFHGYDVDYSLTVQQKYKVAVTFDILIHHFSAGNFNRSWIEEILKVHKKWQKYLPLLVEECAGFEQDQEEKKAAISFMKKMVDQDYSLLEALKIYQFQNEKFRYSLNTVINGLYETVRYKYFSKRAKNKVKV